MPEVPTVVRHRKPPADPEPMTFAYVVKPEAPMLWEQACPDPSLRDQLVEHWRERWAAGDRFSREGDRDAERTGVPEALVPGLVSLLTEIADHFRLPYAPSSTRAAIARYGPGTARDWHVDAGPDSPERWTIAFSLLLNDDFAGGDLEVHPVGPVVVSPGDLVGFTSRTQHRVWPVEHGERFVLLAFGGFGATS